MLLTVFQSLPVDGIFVVTTPQDLVGMIVRKAVKMAEMMHIPVLGAVENMAYALCPDCGKKIYLFGEGETAKQLDALGLPLLASMPIRPETARLCDQGMVEMADAPRSSAWWMWCCSSLNKNRAPAKQKKLRTAPGWSKRSLPGAFFDRCGSVRPVFYAGVSSAKRGRLPGAPAAFAFFFRCRFAELLPLHDPGQAFLQKRKFFGFL